MNIKIEIDRLNNFKLWCFFFLYTFCVSALVQIVLLPYVFPNLHAGNGLLNSSFDSISFHNLAVDVANKIHIKGWSAWQLKPGGHLQVGIASILYFFILPDPRILIPVAAALHAGAALVLFNLLNLFIKNKARTILCILPFLVFPSNLQWTAQWHRDSFSILGVVLILQGIVSLAKFENYKTENWFSGNLFSLISYICGFVLTWLARPYMLMIIVPFVTLLFSMVFLNFLAAAFKKEISWRKASLILLFILSILFVSVQLRLSNFNENSVTARIASEKTIIKNTEIRVVKESTDNVDTHWKQSPQLPSAIESKVYYLSQMRRGFRLSSPEAKSNIDTNIGFGRIKDILIYLPRAAQVAFLAPFPNQWLCEGSCPANSLMRRISAFEMIAVYIALLFLPIAVWHWRRHIEVWIISIFCVYTMLVYGLVVCNIGTLYRMRYIYITTLVALGIAGLIVFLEDLKNIKKKQD